MMEEVFYIKNIFENGWWEDAYPSSYPLEPPLAISYRTKTIKRVWFGTFNFFFTERHTPVPGSQKGGPWSNGHPSKYATELDYTILAV